MPNIEWQRSPNYHKGRNGKKTIAIVNHITAGAFPGCLSWMQNQKSEASAHYLVTKMGRIINLVKDEDTAWHCGIVKKPKWKLYDGTNPNCYTIGIEHESFGEGLTEEQYQATLWLHRQLISKWGIPVDRNHIIGHYMIDSINRPNCPGKNFPWDRLINDLRGGVSVPEKPAEWELEIVKWAENNGILKSVGHDPHETLNLATVLAIVRNAMEVVK